MNFTSESSKRFPTLSAKEKASALDELDFMSASGHLRPAEAKAKEKAKDEEEGAEDPDDDDEDGE